MHCDFHWRCVIHCVETDFFFSDFVIMFCQFCGVASDDYGQINHFSSCSSLVHVPNRGNKMIYFDF